jgi:hypothetical protein
MEGVQEDEEEKRRSRCIQGSYICAHWELRVTDRCLDEDLGRPGASFEDVLNTPIIKAFTSKRAERTEDTRQVNDVRCKVPIWVLARGDDHRGGTLFDAENKVVWLVATRLHRSGAPDDFFPYCVALDRRRRLLPSAADYEKLFDERAERFVYQMRVEAPLLLQKAAASPGTEVTGVLGGRFGVAVTLEVDDDIEVTTVAIKVGETPWEQLMLILAAIHADGGWEPIDGMPHRELEPGEMAWAHLKEST